MKTRSHTCNLETCNLETRNLETRNLETRILPVNINFDEASIEWNKNKRKTGNGCYKYTCDYICKSGNACKKQPIPGKDCCSTHLTKRHS